MPLDPADLPPAALEFLTERHLATLTTLRTDGSPHVTPVGFTWDADAGLARVICSGPSRKAVNARETKRAAICQVDGGRWLTLEGTVEVVSDPARVLDAERRYAARYRPPRENPLRVVLEITVDRILGRI
ncbi:pyridoxamine 5'-phosphate oxidase family protein [Cryptosporangium aurantiacum]|uniref:PPOX class probable F420-dependent enzyme n=1 Tax=Cryptosporangium aurantiacum TaxID=134849 RepID=A0A1M7GXC8_9ACTN|nr:PPOX class F420-dependent oxidoreductase [Cryptosporangium aurantiacum]SHM21011.1 PPOX class probable F420-dependent enzyme [Cryptosporangium aurantiacum]